MMSDVKFWRKKIIESLIATPESQIGFLFSLASLNKKGALPRRTPFLKINLFIWQNL